MASTSHPAAKHHLAREYDRRGHGLLLESKYRTKYLRCLSRASLDSYAWARVMQSDGQSHHTSGTPPNIPASSCKGSLQLSDMLLARHLSMP